MQNTICSIADVKILSSQKGTCWSDCLFARSLHQTRLTRHHVVRGHVQEKQRQSQTQCGSTKKADEVFGQGSGPSGANCQETPSPTWSTGPCDCEAWKGRNRKMQPTLRRFHVMTSRDSFRRTLSSTSLKQPAIAINKTSTSCDGAPQAQSTPRPCQPLPPVQDL